MKRVLFVIDWYLDNTYPNANCVRHVIDYWRLKNVVEADVVCAESSFIDCPNVSNVYPVYYKAWNNRLFDNFSKFFNMPLTKKRMLAGLEQKIKELVSIKQYDALIAVVNPAEAAEAVFRVKKWNSSLYTVLYEIDPTSNRYKTPSGLFQKLWRFCCVRWEKKIYSSFDRIIHMKTHMEHFSSSVYKSYEKKSYYFDIPGIEIRSYNKNDKCDKSYLECIYAGAFYPDLRRPDYMISFFKKISALEKIELKIYTGRMREYISALIKGCNSISLCNVVPEKEILMIQDESDVLVSVGNKNSDYLPSKVLSYISTGKIILHFYEDESDVSLSYLRRYPKAILLNQCVDINSNIKNVRDNLRLIKDTFLTPEFIRKEYKENTIDYTADRLQELL